MSKIIYGQKNVLDAVHNQALIEKIYFVEKPKIKVNNAIKFQKLTSDKMSELVGHNNHEGICARVHDFRYYQLNEIDNDAFNRAIILDHVKQNQNLGTIIRSANAFGVKHVFIIDSNDVASINFDTVKTARGGIDNLKIVKIKSIKEAVNLLKSKGLTIYVTALNEQAKQLGKFKTNNKFAVIVGNESNGVSDMALNLADEIVYINMFGSVQSLNVSVATGIVLFELTKTSD